MEATAPVTVERAAAVLGVSPSTVHRRIRSGALRAEQAERPQGRVWLVHLPAGTAAATEELPPPTAPEATAPTAVPAQAEAMVSLIQATIGTVLGPLVGQLDAQRQTIERQAGELRELEREVGRVSGALDAARGQIRALEARRAPQSAEPTGEPSVLFLRRRWLWVAVMVAFVVLIAAVLAWPH